MAGKANTLAHVENRRSRAAAPTEVDGPRGRDPVVFTTGPIGVPAALSGNGPVPEALLVDGGRIERIGTKAECLRAARVAPRVVDLEGRFLAPGFVDAHMHLLLHGCRLDWTDLSKARSIEEIVGALRRDATARPEAPSVRGYGYDHTVLAEGRHPSARDLDRVDPTRPVVIQHVSGHGFIVSSSVLRSLGITAETPTPPGGRLDRDETGAPTGLVFDAACDLLTGPGGVKVTNHGPNFHVPLDSQALRRCMDLAQESFLAAGVTTVCDAQVTERELAAYLEARDEGRLALRVHALVLSSNLDQLRQLGLGSRLGDERFEILGVKLYADGSVLARTAYLEGECCGHDATDRARAGFLYHEPRELAELIAEAHRLGLPTATHAQGSIPIGMVLDAVAAARDARPRPDLVHRIEHCGFPTDDQVSRMATLRVVPVPQPVQLHHHGDTIEEDLGPIGGRFYPYGAFVREGVPVVISSDAPVTDPAPLEAAWAAITRETVSGAVAGGDELRIDRPAALFGITSTPARLLGLRDVGALEEGNAADLVLLDGDPTTIAIDALRRIKATETWIAGALAWSEARGVKELEDG